MAVVGAGAPPGSVASCTPPKPCPLIPSTARHMSSTASLPPTLWEPTVAVPDLGGAIIGFTIAFPTTVTGAGPVLHCSDKNVVSDSPGSAVSLSAGFTPTASTPGRPHSFDEVVHVVTEAFLATIICDSAKVPAEHPLSHAKEASALPSLTAVAPASP